MSQEYTLKTPEQIQKMRLAGEIVAETLRLMQAAIVPDKTTTLELDEIAITNLKKRGAKPSLLGYQPPFSEVPYLHATCISINNEVIHGVPSAKRILKTGDLVSLDMAASLDGWHADATISTIVGGAGTAKAQKVLSVTRQALYVGIGQARAGKTLGDIGHAIQQYVEKNSFKSAQNLVGHSIGQVPHENGIDVQNEGKPRQGLKLKPGMTICIEPMVCAGKGGVYHIEGDPWTIFSEDGSLACHYEHTVAITEGDPIVLTSPAKE
jgi:methionyl aminopeptidase